MLQLRAVLPAGSRDQILSEIDELLSRFGLHTRLVVLEHANSIVLFFICLTLSAVESLRDRWRSHKLREIVQSLCGFLEAGYRCRIIKLTWPSNDYEKCEEFFGSRQGQYIAKSHLLLDFAGLICCVRCRACGLEIFYGVGLLA